MDGDVIFFNRFRSELLMDDYLLFKKEQILLD